MWTVMELVLVKPGLYPYPICDKQYNGTILELGLLLILAPFGGTATDTILTMREPGCILVL